VRPMSEDETTSGEGPLELLAADDEPGDGTDGAGQVGDVEDYEIPDVDFDDFDDMDPEG
jgi:hypothetical protein